MVAGIALVILFVPIVLIAIAVMAETRVRFCSDSGAVGAAGNAFKF